MHHSVLVSRLHGPRSEQADLANACRINEKLFEGFSSI
jgi:hypothetical protein